MDRHKKELEVLPFAAVCVCVAVLFLLWIQSQFFTGVKTGSTGSEVSGTGSDSIAARASTTVAFGSGVPGDESPREPDAAWRLAADRLKDYTGDRSPEPSLPTGCTAGWSPDESRVFAEASRHRPAAAARIVLASSRADRARDSRSDGAADDERLLPPPGQNLEAQAIENLPLPLLAKRLPPAKVPGGDASDIRRLPAVRDGGQVRGGDETPARRVSRLPSLESGDSSGQSGNSLLEESGTSAAESDPLGGLTPLNDQKPKSADPATSAIGKSEKPPAKDPHADLFLQDQYPSAESCAKCHPKHYEEWRVSAHAYASISPMFQRFEQAMHDLTRGTVGSFCVRCHAPVATQLNTPPSASILDAPKVIREGITCVACHRVNEAYGRSQGDRRIEPGDEYAPMYGTSQGEGLHHAIANAKELKLKLSPDEKGPGQPLHAYGGYFEQLSKSDFCASCHQVAVHPGIWLEIVHAQFRAGPAHAKGISCQDCHMGAVPGKAEGYEFDHCAIINDKPFGAPRRHGNHSFWGPNYSMAHPGVFPHNKDANRYTPRQWLAFEYRNGWGTPDFEKAVTGDMKFPKPWDTKDDRIDGRKIIDANLAKIAEKRGMAAVTLNAAGKVEGPFLSDPSPKSFKNLSFKYKVWNISDGHNLPTGSLGAQPQVWLNVVLTAPDGTRIWESGYLDGNGDLADLNSEQVARHQVPRDAQLFNLQTKFIVNNIRGTDREAPVPLNFSLDQLVFLRPGAVPVSVLNHPPLIRMEAHSIPPLDHRVAHYSVPGHLLTYPGRYRLSVRMRSRPEPPYFVRLVSGSAEMIRRMNENIIDFAHSSSTFDVGGR